MSSLSPQFIATLPIRPEHSWTLAKINEAKGREFLYIEQIPEILDVLRQSAIRESVIASNLIEGITVDQRRERELLAHSLLPQDRSEQEFAAYQNALDQIHRAAGSIALTPANIRNIHRQLSEGIDPEAGAFKTEEVFIVDHDRTSDAVYGIEETSPVTDTPRHIEQLCHNLTTAEEARQLDPLIYIPLAILDYLRIHPFHDGNGRTARLWTLALLYRAGFQIGRYISLERIIEERRPWYYKALQASCAGWAHQAHNPLPWLEFFWSVMESAYAQLSERVDTAGSLKQRRGGKTALIEGFIARHIGSWTMSDVERTFPAISNGMIRKVHADLRKAGRIACQGHGRGAKWIRIDQ
jgi:Fic family protein